MPEVGFRARSGRPRPACGAGLLLACLLGGAAAVAQGAEQWLVGRWALAHDPRGAPVDWLEFTADGDVFSISPQGERVAGFYLVTPRGVRAVFSRGGRDVIMTFHADPGGTALRIVTGAGGASVYRKTGP